MSAGAGISRVLIGVDFEDASAAALKMAGLLATAWGADITVFHAAAADAPAYFTATQLDDLESERQRARTQLIDQLRALAAQHVPRPVHVLVGEGQPAAGMLHAAAGFDLIIVGTHRRHGVTRWWLGSVAEAVVRGAAGPVLVVPAGAQMPERGRSVTILTVGPSVAGADVLVEALQTAFDADIVRSAAIQHCSAERLHGVDVIVVPKPSGDEAHAALREIAHVLKECVHPVLFVPSSGESRERSSS